MYAFPNKGRVVKKFVAMSKVNFTSQICTSRSQSERLLALGLKKETADMHHYQYIDGGRWNIEAHPSIAGYTSRLVPAWSLHRLIEMLGISKMIFNIDLYDSPYEEIIHRIEIFVNAGEFNKEYLEE
jgi:hypothetical protein